ncbi:ABC transporter substrate-binding protein [Rugosimonospora africana]|uniref:Substrate-binding protein n=1 Tax=Rugosimonospora africana TaxID=556532 RepID=A0A8J3QS72_9ACTN|nr:ABC transporter substrate-binding protein [Rugosimonospora africana]GIH14932.1 hypothetical protein Raf01_31040 [Rugosimonospora africana]
MTSLLPASPLLTGSPSHRVDPEATDAELGRLVALARQRGARTIAVGHGRTRAARVAAGSLSARWEADGGQVLATVSWPETAASWLRQATRFAAAAPDIWVMTGPPVGWAQLTRRLLASTDWRPDRTLATAAIGTREALDLVGVRRLDGLAGVAADATTWTVSDGQLIRPAHRPCDSSASFTGR